MKKFYVGLIAGGMSLSMIGCGQTATEITKDTLIINANGSMKEVLVDVFDRVYYDLAEVESMAKSEVDSFNALEGENSVTYKKTEQDDNSNMVKMYLEYEDAESYAEFNEMSFFYGTIEDAYKEGFDLNVKLRSISDSSEQIGLDDILSMGENHILIMESDYYIEFPTQVMYISSNVIPVEKEREVDTEDDNELVYIITK